MDKKAPLYRVAWTQMEEGRAGVEESCDLTPGPPHTPPLDKFLSPAATTLDRYKKKQAVKTRRLRDPSSDGTHDFLERKPPIFVAIETHDATLLTEVLEFYGEAVLKDRYGGFPALHAACQAKNLHALTTLLYHGAKVDEMDSLGHTALHVAVGEGWQVGAAKLLQEGSSPDVQCEPQKKVREVLRETPLHVAVRRGDLATTTLLLGHQPNLLLQDSEGASLLHLAAQSRSLDIVRLILGQNEAKNLTRATDNFKNNALHKVLQRPCETGEEEVVVRDIVAELIKAGVNKNGLNRVKETPLFLAARYKISAVVEYLLKCGADPTTTTNKGRSLLHAACYQGCVASLSLLLQTDQLNDLVTKPDNEDLTPFHFAVECSSIDCCELLLNHGDHLTREDKNGLTRTAIILRQLPSATQLLRRLFDSHVRLSTLPHHDPDFRITFDYSVLSEVEEGTQSCVISVLTNSNLEALLKHPLLESFLLFKWRQIKPFFYCSVSIYFLFLLMHTVFIVLTFGGSPWDWTQHMYTLRIFVVLYVTMFLLILVPDLIIMSANFKKYIRQWETLTKTIALTSSALVVFSFLIPIDTASPKDDTPNNSSITAVDSNSSAVNMSDSVTGPSFKEMPVVCHAAAVSAFFSWLEFMMLLGRFPSLGSYVLMLTRVARSIIKFLAAFSSLIIGFAVSFMVLFRTEPTFVSFPVSLVRTLMMLIGEIDFSTLWSNMESPVMGCIFLVMFLFLACVLLANLLIGLAVNDIPDLQRQGKIRRLAKQASYLVSFERLIVMARNLRCFPRQLRILLTSRCRIPMTVNVYPNKDTRYHRQTHVPSETLQEAILLGTEDSKEELSVLEEDDLAAQFRSFKVKYHRDQRLLQRRLAQLPDTDTTYSLLRQRLDQIQSHIQVQMSQMLVQLQHTKCSCNRQHSLSQDPAVLPHGNVQFQLDTSKTTTLNPQERQATTDHRELKKALHEVFQQPSITSPQLGAADQHPGNN